MSELEQLRNDSKRVVGMNQTLKAIQDGRAKLVFVAADADRHIIDKIKELCTIRAVEIFYADNMKQLGSACSIAVGAAVACLLF